MHTLVGRSTVVRTTEGSGQIARARSTWKGGLEHEQLRPLSEN